MPAGDTPSSGRALLEVRDLRKSWPGAATPLFQDLRLDLREGSMLAIEGANGAGKTTLLRVIAGLLDADVGEVRVCGATAAANRSGYQRAIGLGSAGNTGLYARLNARQHLDLAVRLGFVERVRRGPLVARALERFALADFADRRVDRLSMGQRQRLRLAMAFVHEPPLTLLDEPLTSLDTAGRDLLVAAIDGHRSAGHCVVWCGPSGESLPLPAELHLSLANGALSAA